MVLILALGLKTTDVIAMWQQRVLSEQDYYVIQRYASPELRNAKIYVTHDLCNCKYYTVNVLHNNVPVQYNQILRIVIAGTFFCNRALFFSFKLKHKNLYKKKN